MLHQLARFSAIVPLIEQMGQGLVLDVGSGSEGIASWLGHSWNVTAIDRTFDIAGAMRGPRRNESLKIAGNATDLPFPDSTFDVVLALDVLEHVDPTQRTRALSEIVRVARRRAIVACPTGRAALTADARLADRLRARGMPPPTWLAEHLEHGFPEPEELCRALEGSGALRVLGNENLRWHEWLFTVESRRFGSRASRLAARVIVDGLGSHCIARAISRKATRVAQGPARAPSYRMIAVLDLSAREHAAEARKLSRG